MYLVINKYSEARGLDPCGNEKT
jgi:hypothetical protein